MKLYSKFIVLVLILMLVATALIACSVNYTDNNTRPDEDNYSPGIFNGMSEEEKDLNRAKEIVSTVAYFSYAYNGEFRNEEDRKMMHELADMMNKYQGEGNLSTFLDIMVEDFYSLRTSNFASCAEALLDAKYPIELDGRIYIYNAEISDGIVKAVDLLHADNYGLYDRNANEYILHPSDGVVVSEMSAYVSPYYIPEFKNAVMVKSNEKHGIFDLSTKKYIIEPIYDYLSPCGNNLLCISKDEYYGCIDSTGKTVIGAFYSEPLEFKNGLSVAKSGYQYGVIDTNGNDILEPKFYDIKINDYLIEASEDTYLNDYIYALYTYNGQKVSEAMYSEFVIYDNMPVNSVGKIGARVYGKYHKNYLLRGEYYPIWYDLYDGEGNRLIGEGTSVPEAWGVYLPDEANNMVAICGEPLYDKNGFKYPIPGFNIQGWGHKYISKDMNWLNDNIFENCSEFNEHGYALGEFRSGEIYILDYNGNVVDELTDYYKYDKIDGAYYFYDKNNDGYHHGSLMPYDTNGYIYVMDEAYNNSSDIQAIMLVKDHSILPYGSVKMCENTLMTIVTDTETHLYGLYHKDELVLNTVYNEITIENGIATAKRGAEVTEYIPS